MHHADECRQALPGGVRISIDELARTFLTSAPSWARSLLGVRDRVAGWFGLKTSVAPEELRFQVGDEAGPFRVIARAEDELLLGQDDRHLNFRTSLKLEPGAFVVTTLVQFHNAFGRAYFTPVKPIHARIVRAMCERTAVALSGRTAP
ncbi:MAG: DUF2867 domain-containing protein [Myxococcaceae bacterium]